MKTTGGRPVALHSVTCCAVTSSNSCGAEDMRGSLFKWCAPECVLRRDGHDVDQNVLPTMKRRPRKVRESRVVKTMGTEATAGAASPSRPSPARPPHPRGGRPVVLRRGDPRHRCGPGDLRGPGDPRDLLPALPSKDDLIARTWAGCNATRNSSPSCEEHVATLRPSSRHLEIGRDTSPVRGVPTQPGRRVLRPAIPRAASRGAPGLAPARGGSSADDLGVSLRAWSPNSSSCFAPGRWPWPPWAAPSTWPTRRGPNASRPSAAQPVGSSGSGCSNSQGPSNALTSTPVCRVAASRKSSGRDAVAPLWAATHDRSSPKNASSADGGAQGMQRQRAALVDPIVEHQRPGPGRPSTRSCGKAGQPLQCLVACVGRATPSGRLRPEPLAVAGEAFVQPDVAASGARVRLLPNHWWDSSWAISRSLPAVAQEVASRRSTGPGTPRDLELVLGDHDGVAGEGIGAEQS